jgi:tetratricopeptide (TPR) repeat protein
MSHAARCWCRTSAAPALFLAVASVAASAHAQSVEADSLMREGIALRREGRDAEALDVFRRAYVMRPNARVRAQIGLAEEAVGDWLNAEQDIAAAAGESDPWIAHNAEPLRAALEDVRSHLATLDVQANVESAEIWLDGSLRGNLPLASPLRVIAGTVKLSFKAPGFEPVEQTLTLPGGAELRETVDLHPLAANELPAKPVEPTTPPTPLPAPVLLPVPATSPPPTTPPRGSTTPWLLTGASGVLLVGGVVSSLVAHKNAAIYNDDSRCFYGNLTRDERCGTYRDRALVANTLAVTGYSLGAAAAVASVVLFAMPSSHSHSTTALGCTWAGASFACQGRF